MQLAQFLKTISTPQIESNSFHNILQSQMSTPGQSHPQSHSHKKKEYGFNKGRRGGHGNSTRDVSGNLSAHCCDSSGILKTVTPFYVGRGDRAMNQTLHGRCGLHKKLVSGDVKVMDFMRSREGSDRNLMVRMRIGKEKRSVERNYERFTYQPPKTPITNENEINLRKQYAQAEYVHKFCSMFRIKCLGCKCKLDCFNETFQQFLRKSDLCILKGLDRIIGRGMNLDGDIKAQIMAIYADNHQQQSLQNILTLVREKIGGKLGENAMRKYLTWAKQIIGIVQKFDKSPKRRTAKRLTKIVPNKSMELNVKPNEGSFIRFKMTKSKPKNKQIEANQKNVTQWNDKKVKSKKRETLSIRGSRVSSVNSVSRKNSTLSNRSFSSNQLGGYVDKGKKPRMKKFSDLNKITKKKLKSIISKNENEKYQYEPSRFFEDPSLKPSQNQTITAPQITLLRKQQKQISQSSFTEEDEDKVEERLELFNDILSKFNLSKDRNFLPQQIQKEKKLEDEVEEMSHKFISQKQKTPEIVYKKREKVRKSNMAETRKQSIMVNFKHVSKHSRFSNNSNVSFRNNKSIVKNENTVRSKSKKKIKNHYDSMEKPNCYLVKTKHLSSEIESKRSFVDNNNVKAIFKEISNKTELMSKVEKKLQKKGFISAILCKDDSLLTQKRKIRHIRQFAAKGFLGIETQQVEKYLQIYEKRNNLQKMYEALSESIKQNWIHDQIPKEELQSMIKNYQDLKFYNLNDITRVSSKKKLSLDKQYLTPVQISSDSEPPAEDQKIIPEIEETEISPPMNLPLNMALFSTIETFITKKEHIPFDYYHYLELGTNNHLRKFYYQRNGLKGQESQGRKTLRQIKLVQEPEYSLHDSKLF